MHIVRSEADLAVVPISGTATPRRRRRALSTVLSLLCFGGLVGCGEAATGTSSSHENPEGSATGESAAALSRDRRGHRSPTYRAEIRRTSFGVPHIKADDELGLGYGAAYAYAEDNVCLLADAMVSVNGERSKYFGASNAYDPNGQGRLQNNLSSDFYHKYLNDPSLVLASWSRQPREVQALAIGYAAGYNRFLQDRGMSGLPEACRNQPWVRPLSALDVVRLMRHFTVLASGQHFIDALYAAQPPTPSPGASVDGPPEDAEAASGALASASSHANPHLGSNGVALGREATESGAGLLLANPHFPWTSMLRFYQLHLTIPNKLDAMGASLSGVPLVNIGFNRNVAWTHTVNTSSHFVLYALPLDPSDPTRYVVDGSPRSMTQKRLQVEATDETGAVRTVERSYYVSEFGPVIQWTGGGAIALYDANFDNDRMMQQWWAIDTARSLTEFRRSVESIIGLPWVHAIAADRSGQVYYSDVTPVPFISDQQVSDCAVPLFPSSAAAIVLNGGASACKWNAGGFARQPGIYPASLLPTLQRTDYVQNSNDSAWLTNPARPLVSFPKIVSLDGGPQSGRTRIGLSQIAARLAGTDGLPGARFNLKSLSDVAFSNRSFSATVLWEDLKTACAESGGSAVLDDGSSADISKGCTVLAGWDGTANADSVGWPLFSAWRRLMDASGVEYHAVLFDAADPVGTPRGLRIGEPAIRAAALQAMAKAMAALDARGIDYTKPWGQILVAVRGDRIIPMHGGGDDDIYNALQPVTPMRDGHFDAGYGSSTIWMISFERGTPVAQGLLTYSQSTDPASPHYADQTERFSAKKWISFPFTDEAIEADPEYSTRTIVGE